MTINQVNRPGDMVSYLDGLAGPSWFSLVCTFTSEMERTLTRSYSGTDGPSSSRLGIDQVRCAVGHFPKAEEFTRLIGLVAEQMSEFVRNEDVYLSALQEL